MQLRVAPGILVCSFAVLFAGPLVTCASSLPAATITVEPTTFSLPCAGAFDITITNTSVPPRDVEVRDIHFWHAYSQGWYGQGFTWNLGQITMPFILSDGESITIHVVYDPTDQGAPSRLHLIIEADGMDESRGWDGVYTGSRTVEPGWMEHACTPCAGDCNGDGSVTVDEILHGIAEVTGRSLDPCSTWEDKYATFCDPCALAFDRDHDGKITIAELITSVRLALDGCTAPGSP